MPEENEPGTRELLLSGNLRIREGGTEGGALAHQTQEEADATVLGSQQNWQKLGRGQWREEVRDRKKAV